MASAIIRFWDTQRFQLTIILHHAQMSPDDKAQVVVSSLTMLTVNFCITPTRLNSQVTKENFRIISAKLSDH
jgi:hypothetical protein